MPYIRDRQYAIEIIMKKLIRLNLAKCVTPIWVPRYLVTTFTWVSSYYAYPLVGDTRSLRLYLMGRARYRVICSTW